MIVKIIGMKLNTMLVMIRGSVSKIDGTVLLKNFSSFCVIVAFSSSSSILTINRYAADHVVIKMEVEILRIWYHVIVLFGKYSIIKI